MRVTVRFFAGPREALGKDEVSLEIASGTTLSALLARLTQEFPALQEFGSFLHFAVNRRYADLDAELHDGDEVVCVPPVGGG